VAAAATSRRPTATHPPTRPPAHPPTCNKVLPLPQVASQDVLQGGAFGDIARPYQRYRPQPYRTSKLRHARAPRQCCLAPMAPLAAHDAAVAGALEWCTAATAAANVASLTLTCSAVRPVSLSPPTRSMPPSGARGAASAGSGATQLPPVPTLPAPAAARLAAAAAPSIWRRLRELGSGAASPPAAADAPAAAVSCRAPRLALLPAAIRCWAHPDTAATLETAHRLLILALPGPTTAPRFRENTPSPSGQSSVRK
jgi:hypothetical protein